VAVQSIGTIFRHVGEERCGRRSLRDPRTLAPSSQGTRDEIESDPATTPKPDFSALTEIHDALRTEDGSRVMLEQSTPVTTITVLTSSRWLCNHDHGDSNAASSIEAQIQAERNEISAKQAKLDCGGYGPVQAREVQQDIREREAIIASLERQLDQIKH
jgi:hypothetical protein